MPATFNKRTVVHTADVSSPTRKMAISQDGTLLCAVGGASGTGNWQISRYNPALNRYDTVPRTGITFTIYNIVFTPDNTAAYVYSHDDMPLKKLLIGPSLVTVDTSWGTISFPNLPTTGQDRLVLMELSPDGNYLAVNDGAASPNFSVKIFNANTKALLFTLTESGSTVSLYGWNGWSRDGNLLAVSSTRGILIIKKTGTNTFAQVMQGGTAGVILTPYGSVRPSGFAWNADSSVLVGTHESFGLVFSAFVRGENDIFTQIQTPIDPQYIAARFIRHPVFLGPQKQFLCLTPSAGPGNVLMFKAGAPGNGMFTFETVSNLPATAGAPGVSGSLQGNIYFARTGITTERYQAYEFVLPPEITGVLSFSKMEGQGRFEQKREVAGALGFKRMTAAGSAKVPIAFNSGISFGKLSVKIDVYRVEDEQPLQSFIELLPTFLQVTTAQGVAAVEQTPSFLFSYGALSLPSLKAEGIAGIRPQINGDLAFKPLAANGSISAPPGFFGDIALPRMTFAGAFGDVVKAQADLGFKPLRMRGLAGPGVIFAGDVRLPGIRLDLQGGPEGAASGDLKLNRLGLSVSVQLEKRTVEGAVEFSRLQSDGSVGFPSKVSGALTLPRVAFSGAFGDVVKVQADIGLPALGVSGVAGPEAQIEGVFTFATLRSGGLFGPDIPLYAGLNFPPMGISGVVGIKPSVFGDARLGTLKTAGLVDVPKLTISAEMALPAMTAEAYAGWPVDIDTDVRLPRMTFAGAFGDVVKVQSDIVLPKLRVTGLAGPDLLVAGDVAFRPMRSTGFAAQHVVIDSDVAMPSMRLAMRIDPTILVDSDIDLPRMIAGGRMTVGIREVEGAPSLPAFAVAGYVEQPVQVRGAVGLPKMTMLGGGYQIFGIAGQIYLPRLRSDGLIERSNTLEGAFRFRKMRVDGRVERVRRVTGILNFPGLRAAGSAKIYFPVSGGLSLPSLTIAGAADAYFAVRGQTLFPALALAGDLDVVSSYEVEGALSLAGLVLAGRLTGDQKDDRPAALVPSFTSGTSGNFSISAATYYGTSGSYRAG